MIVNRLKICLKLPQYTSLFIQTINVRNLSTYMPQIWKKERKLNGENKRLRKHAKHLDQGWGTYSLSLATWTVQYRWRAKKK